MRTTLSEASALYESACEPQGSPFRSSRVRLERALEEAADEWNHSWLARLRGTLAVSPTRAGLGAAVVLVIRDRRSSVSLQRHVGSEIPFVR